MLKPSVLTLTEKSARTAALAAGLQTDPSGGPGDKLPPQSLSCPAAPGPEAEQRAAGLLSECQGDFQGFKMARG